MVLNLKKKKTQSHGREFRLNFRILIMNYEIFLCRSLLQCHTFSVTGQLADHVRNLPQGDAPYVYGTSVQKQIYTVELLMAMDYSVYNT